MSSWHVPHMPTQYSCRRGRAKNCRIPGTHNPSCIEEFVNAQDRKLRKFDFGKDAVDDPPNALRLVFTPVKAGALFAAVVDSLAARAVA